MDDSSLVSTVRGLSALAFFLNIICAVVFMSKGGYLSVIISLYTLAISLFVLVSIVQQPSGLFEKMNNHAEFIFTYKGRLIVDFFLSLFLFGMGGFGVAMGIITLILIVGIRFLASPFPGAFEQLFRQENSSTDSFDSPYGDAGGFAPQPSADL